MDTDVQTMTAKDNYTLYGWHLSYFSGKTRAYLRYKRIPHRDKAVDAYTLMRRIPRKTGATVMPVVVTPDGIWLQDTTEIIAALEQRFPQPAIFPTTPRQHAAVLLLEAWADEFWIPMAMHYRWSYPENYALFEHDAGRALLPHLPGVLQRRLARFTADRLRGFLPTVGVVESQFELMERWTEHLLDSLETHFQQHPYLLGGRPTLADFALVGPMYAHLNRDPAPKRLLLDPRPALQSWVERVHDGAPAAGNLLADDALPDTLGPVFASVFGEFLPYVGAIREQVAARAAAAADDDGQGKKPRLPRTLKPVDLPLLGERFTRRALPYTLWMVQRIRDQVAGWPTADRDAVDAWFAEQGAISLSAADLGPALRRAAVKAEFA